MKVSRHWLEKFFDQPLPDASALSDALTFHAFEIDGVEKFARDDILDVKVTPNRGHDCLSHRGIAKELSAILKLPFAHDPFTAAGKDSVFSAAGLQGDAAKTESSPAVSITLEDPTLSPRYIAGYIKGVKVGPSPTWLKRNLESIGQRSINNVVDATNFVMFNTGQPLHAFDAGKLTQKDGKFHIVVRKARAGEKLLALDNKEYELKDSMLVIADGNADVPVGIAGIKGGTPAGITEATTDIIIESANFNSVSVRKTAQALKLRTDASSRFEQGLSPELASQGMHGMFEFVQHLIGGEAAGVFDVYPAPQQPTRVSVSVEKINKVLGTQLTGAEVADVFQRLQFAYIEEGGMFDVAIPAERLDLTIAEDLVEEVGRIIGYEAVPTVPLPIVGTQPEINQNFYTAEHVRKQLTDMGYSEVFTSVFADKGERAVLNKVDSVKPYLRANLTDGLDEALKKNIPNKDLLGLKEIKLFEIGKTWEGGKEEWMVGIVTEKEKAVEEPLSQHAPKETVSQYEDLPLSNAQRFQPFSKYPYIVRDIAMWTPAGTDAESVSKMIQTEAGELCIKVSLFDQFQKGEKTSLAFRLVFQSFEKTLTEIEVNQIMEKVSAKLKEKGFEIR
ncbi:MAG TPA: phenylalanine--tRNA ligase subunit beta [Candidatus Paceibacterota bacterium]|nr:phenylalanine--tRNA ligase subunit beta [Candidatus Paceibacterota bacterium]